MKTHFSSPAGHFLEELLGQGRYIFTREEAEQRFRSSSTATYMSLHRLIKSGRIIMPRAGFYVIVDPQHRSAGSIPPEWFIHDLMKDINKPYYVGLLSAAQLYGASHQRPQEFQVIIPTRTIRPIKAGNILIRFYGKGLFSISQINDVKTPTGIIKVSTPESTAWDIVRYFKACGGMDNVITVLSELVEKLDAVKLRKIVIQHNEIIVAQRLGYLLDIIGRPNLTKGFSNLVRHAPLRLLDPSMPTGKSKKNKKWQLLINTQLEPET